MKRLRQKFARVTKETITENYSKLNEKEVKLFCYIVSELQVELMLADKSERDVYYLEGQEKEIDDIGIIKIPINQKFSEIYKSHLTLTEVKSLVAGVQSMVIAITDENRTRFINPFKCEILYKPLSLVVSVDKLAIDYIVYLKNNWLTIYNDELKELTGKFMIGLYIKYKEFERTGFIRMKIEDAKKYFDCGGYETKVFVSRLKIYVQKFNAKFEEKNIKLELILEKNESTRKITHIMIKFNPQVNN